MKTVNGLHALIEIRSQLPGVGWIFIDRGFDKESSAALIDAVFYVPESEDDEFLGEKTLATWLEVPTFLDILEVREKYVKIPSILQYAEAATYYLEKDDFLE